MRRIPTAGALANTSLIFLARTMRNCTTSYESIWSCPLLRVTSIQEAAGGEYFALRKLNEGGAPVDVRGIVFGSTYRQCSAKLAVADSSTAVAEYLMGEFECTRESRSSVEVIQESFVIPAAVIRDAKLKLKQVRIGKSCKFPESTKALSL